jgi:putative membrane protein
LEYLSWFPHINASLNALSGIFLIFGFIFIKLRKIHLHRACMLSAFTSSCLFLACYLFYHFFHGTTAFQGQGAVRIFYFILLGTHTILAALMAPFILVTLWRALKGKFEIHRRLARWVFPVWLYVSVTGVIVYLMLYQIYK